MSRSAQQQKPVADDTLDVSVHALLDANSRGVISLTKAEVRAFSKMNKSTPVTLRGPMAEAMYADAFPSRKAKKAKAVKSLPEPIATLVEEAEDDEEEVEVTPPVKAKTTRRPTKPVKTETNVATEKAPEAKGSKKARAAKVAEENKPKRAAKGEGQSRTPAARRARRILREYLRVSLIASDETEDEETREAAQARASYLEEIIGREDLG